MADLTTDDFQFSLADVAWGHGLDVFVPDGGFDPGEAAPRVQDQPRSLGNGLIFGRDFRDAPIWTWELNTNHTELEDAEAALDALETAWRTAVDSEEPGGHIALYYSRRTRSRLVYGRPRRFVRPQDNRALSGLSVAQCDFQRADDLHYAAAEDSMVMSIVPTTSGGLISPLISPLTTSIPSGPRQGFVTVEGSAPTYPVVTFSGPIQNPRLYMLDGSWEIALLTTLTAGQSAVIDTRPWRMTAKRGAANISGALTRATRLADAKLPPGTHELGFTGVDGTGTATATVSWRSAWYSL